jgi:hypothetical protein
MHHEPMHHEPAVPVMLPKYAYIGLCIMAVSEAALFAHVAPFWSWHTPIAWTGYILFVDGYVFSKRGSSWLTTNRGEFFFLALVSIPLWLVFEGYNLLIHNWHYINLPRILILRYLGYAWAFATIWPGIFETAELIAVLRLSGSRVEGQGVSERGTRVPLNPQPLPLVPNGVLVIAGAAMLIWPLLRPSPYLSIPVWLGFIALLDPLNDRAGAESLMGDWRSDRRDRLVNLIVAGFVCGVLWEFWNYWSLTKWIYTIPYTPNLKIFEMPVLGYFGFPTFALECFTMYILVRRIFWRGPARPIGL